MADFDPIAAETEDEEYPPLGLTNPLLPPEPLGQEPLYPQFLMPVAAAPIMAVNPSMFFPEGIPGYQPSENPFQESPFFTEARASLRTGQALGLPEVLEGARRVPRPILSDLLGDLEFQTDFEAPAESPEPTNNEIEIAEVPTLEGFEVTEKQEIQPIPLEEVELPTGPEVETKELIESPPELSPSPPESSSNPLSVQAASEENYVADASLAEPIAAELSLQATEFVGPELPIVFSSVAEELGSPVVPQSEESPEETEIEIVPELPELIEQPSEVEGTVSLEAELPEKTEIPEPITANFPSPELAEILTGSVAENITSEPEPLPVTQTAASRVMSELEQTALELEEVPESSELTEVQSEPEAVEALEPTTPEPENTELIEVELAVSPEGEILEAVPLVAIAESAAEENEFLPEQTNEAPVLPTEEVAAEEEIAAEIVEPPVPNPEIIAGAVEEPIDEELVGSVAESTPFLAEAELTSSAEPETPPSMAVSAEIEPVEELENTEQLPSNEESIAVPEVIPEGEPLAAEQNQSEEAVAITAEPFGVTPQEMVAAEAEQNPENQPESESGPPISRIQEFVEHQIEAFSGLEQEEVTEEKEEASTAPESAVPPVIEEGAQPPAVEENLPLEIPPEVAATEIATPALEIPIVSETESESAPLQSNIELPVTQSEANVEPVLSLPTILENLGILTPFSTLSPLTQLTNFLPVTEPFTSQRREGIPLGLEQPMTFASPPIPSSPLNQNANFLPVTEHFALEQREGIPLGIEQPMTFASITPLTIESGSPTAPNFPGSNEESNLSETRSSTPDSSTETESSISQEEILHFSEAMSSLQVVSTLPVMHNEGIFTPLTFAQKSINNTPINEQETGSPNSLSTPNIPQQWSSIEEFINSNPSIERDGFNSLFSPEVPIIGNKSEGEGYTPEISNFMSSRSLENGEEQNYISGSTSLGNMNEEILNLQGEEDEDSSSDELNEDREASIDLEVLAKEIYGLLQQRLVIERERQGYYTGRLPW